MYNHNKAQQSKNRVHISWDMLYASSNLISTDYFQTVRLLFPRNISFITVVLSKYGLDL